MPDGPVPVVRRAAGRRGAVLRGLRGGRRRIGRGPAARGDGGGHDARHEPRVHRAPGRRVRQVRRGGRRRRLLHDLRAPGARAGDGRRPGRRWPTPPTGAGATTATRTPPPWPPRPRAGRCSSCPTACRSAPTPTWRPRRRSMPPPARLGGPPVRRPRRPGGGGGRRPRGRQRGAERHRPALDARRQPRRPARSWWPWPPASEVHMANVGDARGYAGPTRRASGWSVEQLTTDDSVAARAVAQGIDRRRGAQPAGRPRHHRLAGRRRPRRRAHVSRRRARARRPGARVQRRAVELRAHRPGARAGW